VRFGVVGDPVDHSRSPAIHNAGFASLGIDATFEPIQVDYDAFDTVVADLRCGELDGVSVTMPHKDHAYTSVDVRDELADRSGAVNTIVAEGDELHGYNTDVAGVRHAIGLLGLAHDAPVLILGYGGAARAALVALEGRDVTITGRDLDRATSVIRSVGIAAEIVQWGTALDDAVVVNATPLGMHGEHLPDALLHAACGFVDMAYGTHPTPAIALAASTGIPHSDGIDMLVGQAVRAFELFTARSAPIGVLERAARGA
jgi:shikimate dehydrogenase